MAPTRLLAVLGFSIVVTASGSLAAEGNPASEQKTDKPAATEQDEADLRGWGIATGFMYAQGRGQPSYVSSAYIDLLGYVRVRNNLQRINRVFPSVTAYIKPSCFWGHPPTTCSFFFGGTIGVPTGASNDGGGSPMAFGLTLGVASKGIHAGIFFGIIQDPSVRVLPWYVYPNAQFPDPRIQGLLSDLRQGSNSPALALFQGLELPTSGVTGRYPSIGLIFSISI